MKPSIDAVLGLFSGGLVGLIAGSIPIFHWEMVGLFLIPFTCVGGLFAGVLGATRGPVFGGLAGSLSFGTFWLIFAKTGALPPDDPWGIPAAGTVAVIIASFIASIVTSSRFSNAKQQNQEKRESNH